MRYVGLVIGFQRIKCRVKPGSYFLRMRSKFDVNLTSHPPFAVIIREGVEQSSTAANRSLRICDVKIRFAFAFARSMNRASVTALIGSSESGNATLKGLW